MRKVILAAAVLGLSIGGAFAQTSGPTPQDSTKMKPEHGTQRDTMKPSGGATTGTTTGSSKADRATVPGSLNAGGTSQSSPNTTQPGASNTGK